tara:strand:- start:8444 stop:8788 length:345 start_codon:yes stop_codon:yes gene_type:complete
MKLYALSFDVNGGDKDFAHMLCEVFGSKREALARYRELSPQTHVDTMGAYTDWEVDHYVYKWEHFTLTKIDVPTDKKGLADWLTKATIQYPLGETIPLPHRKKLKQNQILSGGD